MVGHGLRLQARGHFVIEIFAQPKAEIGAFVNARQGLSVDHSWGNYTALGLVKHGELVAGVIYNNVDGSNICMHIGAIDGCRWLTPGFLFAAFDYPFNQLGMRRVTAPIKSGNNKAIEFVENLGFEMNGNLKHYYPDGDLSLYGLLRQDCRFLEMKKAA
jgi:RimJ/RimL family protein N-acetyltransferase